VRAGVIAMVAATAFLTVMRILGHQRQRRSVVVNALPDGPHEADAPTLDDRVPSLR
jgi:hypothetical protein